MLNRIKTIATQIASNVSQSIARLFGFDTQIMTVEQAQINVVVQIVLTVALFSIGCQIASVMFALCAIVNTTNLVLYYVQN